MDADPSPLSSPEQDTIDIAPDWVRVKDSARTNPPEVSSDTEIPEHVPDTQFEVAHTDGVIRHLFRYCVTE